MMRTVSLPSCSVYNSTGVPSSVLPKGCFVTFDCEVTVMAIITHRRRSVDFIGSPSAQYNSLIQQTGNGRGYDARRGENRRLYMIPSSSNTAPHHTLAWNRNSTTGFAGG